MWALVDLSPKLLVGLAQRAEESMVRICVCVCVCMCVCVCVQRRAWYIYINIYIYIYILKSCLHSNFLQ
jgi:hypothetical protein